MSARIAGDEDEPIAEINIVPFVDIILVVLIIFMVTAPIMLKPSINVSLPKAGSGDSTAPSELTVTIRADGGYHYSNRPDPLPELNFACGGATCHHAQLCCAPWLRLGSDGICKGVC